MEMTLPPMATAEVADVVRLPHQHGPPEPAEDLGVDEGGAVTALHPTLLYIERIPADGSPALVGPECHARGCARRRRSRRPTIGVISATSRERECKTTNRSQERGAGEMKEVAVDNIIVYSCVQLGVAPKTPSASDELRRGGAEPHCPRRG